MEKLSTLSYEKIAPIKSQLIIYIPAGTNLYDLYQDIGIVPGSNFSTIEDIKLVLEKT